MARWSSSIDYIGAYAEAYGFSIKLMPNKQRLDSSVAAFMLRVAARDAWRSMSHPVLSPWRFMSGDATRTSAEAEALPSDLLVSARPGRQ